MNRRRQPHLEMLLKRSSCPAGLDSGDIVLFNRRCMSMAPTGAALCAVAKFFSNSAWDHVGIVVTDPNTGELLFLEADFGGVKLRSLHERITRSRSREIAIRKLDVVRTDAMRTQLYAFSQEMLGRPYDLSTGSVMARVTNQEEKHERAHYHGVLIEKRLQLEEIARELNTGALTSLQRRFLQNEFKRVEMNISFVESHLERLSGDKKKNSVSPDGALALSEDQITSGAASEHNPYGEYSKDLSRVFCSELVAAAYQQMGLLESYPPPFSYIPKAFSSEPMQPPGLHLLRKARLGNEIFFRMSPTRAEEERARAAAGDVEARYSTVRSERQQPRYRGIAEGDNPLRDSRMLIRDVVRRTPLHNTIPDAYKRSHFVKSFQAYILEPGDVLYYQGDYGNELFVIESGKVDRFVGKGNENPILVSTLGPRNSFGLTGFSYTSKRGATIRARERTLLWKVDRATYEKFKDTSIEKGNHLTGADQRMLRGILKDHFLFSRMDRLGPKEVNAFFPVSFRAGEEIFAQGDAGDNFYIVKSGEVERHIRHPRTRKNKKSGHDWREEEEKSLAKTLGAGQSFGELSLMYNAPRASTMRARTDVECFAISDEAFHRLNLGGGTQLLKKRFEKSASVDITGKLYMTPDDFVSKIANIDDFHEKDRERLSSLLVSLVTSNRERDPVKAARQRGRAARKKKGVLSGQHVMSNADRTSDSLEKENHSDQEDDGSESVLMDFWEFVRFDIVLNQAHPEMDFAFRLADQDNTGFISLDEMQYLLQLYADIDDTAKKMLYDESPILKEAFGKDGSKVLSFEEFHELSNKILPPVFIDDVWRIADHMRNVDIRTEDEDFRAPDLLVEDGSPSIIGSQFVPKGAKPENSSSSSSFVSDSLTLKEERRAKRELPVEHMICVTTSAALSRTVVAPLERLKILMQTDTARKFRGIVSGFKTMVREDTGVVRSMFRGNGANLLRIIPSCAIQLAVVTSLSKAHAASLRQSGDEDTMRFKAIESVLIGGTGGIIANAAVYPLEYARGRLSVQRAGFEPYKGTIDALRKSVAKDGLTSIYRGLTPSVLGVFPYVGFSFGLYEALRPILPKRNDDTAMPSTGAAILAGGGVLAAGQLTTYPLDTCRRRMQVAGFASAPYAIAGANAMSATVAAGAVGATIGKVSFIDTARSIFRTDGIAGFYRGVVPNFLKVVPSTAVSFFAFEYVRSTYDKLDAMAVRALGRQS